MNYKISKTYLNNQKLILRLITFILKKLDFYLYYKINHTISLSILFNEDLLSRFIRENFSFCKRFLLNFLNELWDLWLIIEKNYIIQKPNLTLNLIKKLNKIFYKIGLNILKVNFFFILTIIIMEIIISIIVRIKSATYMSSSKAFLETAMKTISEKDV